jgi:hypothetical protein
MKKTKAILSLFMCAVLMFSVFSTVALAVDLGTLAAEFNAAVDSFANVNTLETNMETIAFAEAKLEAYISAGGNKEDTAIAENYIILSEKKETVEALVEACDSFCDYVAEAATHYADNNYPLTRENLDSATEYLDLIPISDPYVSGAYSEYTSIVGALRQPEMICESFVAYAKQAAEATTYAEIERHLKNARNAERSITLDGFINQAEAYANIEKAEAMKKAKKTEALVFIAKVQLIKHDDLASFREALKALEGVDTTTEGVEAAEDKLESYIDAYNAKVKAANEALASACKIADSVM